VSFILPVFHGIYPILYFADIDQQFTFQLVLHTAITLTRFVIAIRIFFVTFYQNPKGEKEK
jgi:hypothetical protein